MDRKLSAARFFLLVIFAGLADFVVASADNYARAAAAGGNSEVVLGADMMGEACRAVQRPARSADPGTKPPLDIFCGKSSHPVGTMLAMTLPGALPLDTDERNERLAGVAEASPLFKLQEQQLICEKFRRSSLVDDHGGAILIASCRAKDGDWPYVSLAAAVGDQIFIGNIIPSGVLALQRTIGFFNSQGRPNTSLEIERAPASERDAKIRELEASLGQKLEAFGSADLDAFRDLIELGRLYDSFQDYVGSERAYLQALQIQSRALSPDNPGVADTLLALALEVSNQGRAEEAEALFRRATPLLQRSVDPILQARYSSYEALATANRGQFHEALLLAQDAVAKRKQLLVDTGESRPSSELNGGSSGLVFSNTQTLKGELAQGLYLLAAIALKLDDTSTATSSISEALDILNNTPGLPPWWRPRFLIIAAAVSERNGRAEDAETQLSVALELATKLNGQGKETASVHLALGRLYYAEGLPGKAVDQFRLARSIFASESGVSPSQQRLPRFQPYLDALAELGTRLPAEKTALDAEMFEVSQSDNEGGAAQTIARTAARIAAGDPAIGELVRSAQDAARDRDTLQLQLATETAKSSDRRDPAVEADLTNRLQQLSERARVLDARIRDAYPAYSKLVSPASVSVDQITAQLREGEGLISFAIGSKHGFGFLITRHGLIVRSIDRTADDLDEQVADLRRAFVLQAGVPQPFDIAASFKLYKALLGPFEPEITSLSHLIVVPSGGMFSLPLALLVTAEPASGQGGNYLNAAWLAKRSAISITPSVQAFIDLQALASRPSARDPFIGFGAPNFTGAAGQAGNSLRALGAECRTGGPASNDLIRALAPLPETADEVRRVAAALHASSSDIILGSQVTKATLRGLSLDRYRVLYFATHGLLPGELRCQSEPGLALTPGPGEPESPKDDALLVTTEISGWHVNADLVVLSACNTAGDGKHLGGQSLSGLAESFFFAGSRSVLASHWQVASISTVALMSRLFDQLSQDPRTGVAQALRLAQLSLASSQQTAHPYYWAAFTLIGNGSTRSTERAALEP